MATVDRIRRQRDCTAMAALDSMDLIAERVTKLLSWGRRISMTRRYTYTGHSPDLYVGLTIDKEAHGGGIIYNRRAEQAGIAVYLRPGLTGFGIHAYSGINDTEKAEWARYHSSDDKPHGQRRRMTVVTLCGGLPGDEGPARDDSLKIEHWNDDAVCEEIVIGFDTDAYWAERQDH